MSLSSCLPSFHGETTFTWELSTLCRVHYYYCTLGWHMKLKLIYLRLSDFMKWICSYLISCEGIAGEEASDKPDINFKH